jgi:hypothetical protein
MIFPSQYGKMIFPLQLSITKCRPRFHPQQHPLSAPNLRGNKGSEKGKPSQQNSKELTKGGKLNGL